MHESLANQLVIAAWDIVMSQVMTCGSDKVKRESLCELAALVRMALSDELLAAAHAVTRRWKARDTGRLHRTTFNDVLSLLGAATPHDGIWEEASTERNSRTSATFATTEKALAQLVGHAVSEVERVLVLGTLKQLGGNRTRTATGPGISLRTLRNKPHRYAQEGETIPVPLVVGIGLGRRHHIG